MDYFTPLPEISNFSQEDFNKWPRSGIQTFINCPSWIYAIYIFLFLFIGLLTIVLLPNQKQNGVIVTDTQKWTIGLLSLLSGLFISIIFIILLVWLCKFCQDLASWILLIAGVFTPILITFIAFFTLNALGQMYW